MRAIPSPNSVTDNHLIAGAAGLDLSNQKVAVFGLGDSASYGDYFCDAIEEVRSTLA